MQTTITEMKLISLIFSLFLDPTMILSLRENRQLAL